MPNVHPVEEQHVEVDIQIQCTAKTQNQVDRASLSHLPGETRFLDQVRGDAAVDDANAGQGPAGQTGRCSNVVAEHQFILVQRLHLGASLQPVPTPAVRGVECEEGFGEVA